MALRFRLEVDASELESGIRQTVKQVPGVMARALNRTAFEVRDAMQQEVRGKFRFSGSSTETFLAGRGAFVFNAASASKLQATFFARDKTAAILGPHVRGATLKPGPGRLVIAGKLATPVSAKRGGRGRVRRSRLQTFISRSGRAVVERTARGERRVRFALAGSVKLRPRFDFFGVVRRTAVRAFPEKLREEWSKLASSLGRG